VIELRTGSKIWLAAGITDMRRGFDGLSAQVQTVLEQQPFSGHVFVFRGRGGDIVNFFGSMETAYVCSPSVWRRAASSGHKLRKGLFR
jgi:transposase